MEFNGYFDREDNPRELCGSCREANEDDVLRTEAMRPLSGQPGVDALSRYTQEPRKICADCNAAETLMGLQGMTWDQARIAIANDRQEQLRLPGAPLGILVTQLGGQFSKEGELDDCHRWLDAIGCEDWQDEGPD